MHVRDLKLVKSHQPNSSPFRNFLPLVLKIRHPKLQMCSLFWQNQVSLYLTISLPLPLSSLLHVWLLKIQWNYYNLFLFFLRNDLVSLLLLLILYFHHLISSKECTCHGLERSSSWCIFAVINQKLSSLPILSTLSHTVSVSSSTFFFWVLSLNCNGLYVVYTLKNSHLSTLKDSFTLLMNIGMNWKRLLGQVYILLGYVLNIFFFFDY